MVRVRRVRRARAPRRPRPCRQCRRRPRHRKGCDDAAGAEGGPRIEHQHGRVVLGDARDEPGRGAHAKPREIAAVDDILGGVRKAEIEQKLNVG